MNKTIYDCDICGNRYERDNEGVQVACAVNHLRGSCCHYGEKRVKV